MAGPCGWGDCKSAVHWLNVNYELKKILPIFPYLSNPKMWPKHFLTWIAQNKIQLGRDNKGQNVMREDIDNPLYEEEFSGESNTCS